jgi:hypothetical protein
LAFCLKEIQALEAYAQKRRAEFGIHQLAHVGRTKAVRQRLIRANARERLLDWWMKITREENWHGDTDETGASTCPTTPTERPGPTPG